MNQIFRIAAHNPSFNDIRSSTSFDGELLDLCVPVNPHFPPEELLEMIRRDLPEIVKYYPDYAEEHQRNLSALTGIPAENIVAANGSTELITLLCRDAAGPVATPVPTFGRWTDLPRDFGIPVEFIPRRREDRFRLSVGEIVGRVRAAGARTLVVCNPDNPTGAHLEPWEVERLVSELADLSLVVIDESFIDFSSLESAARSAVASANTIVVKSLGKSLGWHGVRLGYAVANARLARRLRLQTPFWNINGLAAYVLKHVVGFRDAYLASFAKAAEDRLYMRTRLAEIGGLAVHPSRANFLYCELPPGASGRRVRDALLERHGLIVRECGNKVGSSESYLRLAVRQKDATDRLVPALRACLSDVAGGDQGSGTPR